jgi:hypothetical protein
MRLSAVAGVAGSPSSAPRDITDQTNWHFPGIADALGICCVKFRCACGPVQNAFL